MNHDPRPSASIVKILVRPPLCNPFRSFLSILLIPRLASALPGKHSGQWEGATPHFKLQLEGMYRLSFTSYLSCRIAIFPIAWQFQPLGAAGEIHLRVSRDFSLGKHDFDGYPSAKSPRSTSGLQLVWQHAAVHETTRQVFPSRKTEIGSKRCRHRQTLAILAGASWRFPEHPREKKVASNVLAFLLGTGAEICLSKEHVHMCMATCVACYMARESWEGLTFWRIWRCLFLGDLTWQ